MADKPSGHGLNMAGKPSKQLADVLSGRVPMEDAPEAIQSWAQFSIYRAARTILAQDTKGERRTMLSRIPAPVRPYVEAEVKRLWSDR